MLLNLWRRIGITTSYRKRTICEKILDKCCNATAYAKSVNFVQKGGMMNLVKRRLKIYKKSDCDGFFSENLVAQNRLAEQDCLLWNVRGGIHFGKARKAHYFLCEF